MGIELAKDLNVTMIASGGMINEVKKNLTC